MSALEVVVACAAGAASAGGVWLWARQHGHPELVHRNELSLLTDLIESKHQAVLRELSLLREALDAAIRRR